MADEGGHAPTAGGGGGGGGGHGHGHGGDAVNHGGQGNDGHPKNEPLSREFTMPLSPGRCTPNPFSRQQTSLDIDDYFTGPRDIRKHSKWPLFLQMHGSILPKMIVPLIFVGAWATAMTLVHQLVHGIGVSSILLTVTGFVVGLGLSFRSSTAYERYAEGRRYWAQLILSCQSLGRIFWIHALERPETKEKDILAKLTAMNLLTAFAVALKHKLRYEPWTAYDDLSTLVGHIDTLARDATAEQPEQVHRPRPSPAKAVGEYLGISFAASNPRKAIKKSARPLGNLPLEILTYLASFVDDLVAGAQLPVPMQQTLAYNNVAALNDILVGTERVLSTPLPIAYAIAISQITWVYVVLMPFQLLGSGLGWITIPATVGASYIILGLLFIGREIENPFGQDVNDLPLEDYCAQVAAELDVIASRPRPRQGEWIESLDNKVLYPMSSAGWNVWMHRGEAKLREALRVKTEMGFEMRMEMMGQQTGNQQEQDGASVATGAEVGRATSRKGTGETKVGSENV